MIGGVARSPGQAVEAINKVAGGAERRLQAGRQSSKLEVEHS